VRRPGGDAAATASDEKWSIRVVNLLAPDRDSRFMSPLLRLSDPDPVGRERQRPADAREDVVPAAFRQYAADLVRLAHCLTGDRGAAEEAVQDAFVSLYRNWDRLRDRSALLPYLRVAVVNRCRSAHRSRARVLRTAGPLTPELVVLPGADAAALANDDARRVAERVRTLPQRQREVVVCRYYLDLTERQTADLLEISVGSVKKHASRALARLHDQLEVAR
jgi:RNA polymerase sigma-70 factor (sigma-E family)